MSARHIRLSGLGAAIALAGMACGAHAQSGATQPPEFPQLDENGVDVQTGALTLSIPPDLTIGGDSAGALEFARYFSANSWRNNFTNILHANYDANAGPSGSASFGNTGDSFDSNGSTTGNGSVMEFNAVSPGNEFYKLKNGMRINFGITALQEWWLNGTSPVDSIFAYADRVNFPNGVIWTIHNKVIPKSSGLDDVRIQSVTSNTGFQIKFIYESALHPTESGYTSGSWIKIVKVIGINNAVEYCNPMADTCTLTQSWPEATYTETLGNGYVRTATNAAGEETRYTWEYNGSSPSFLRIKTPGSSSDNITYRVDFNLSPCFSAPFSPCLYSAQRVAYVNYAGNTTTYTYSPYSFPQSDYITRTDPLGKQTTYYSNVGAMGVERVVDPLLRETLFSRDAWGRPKVVKAPELNEWRFDYDGNGTPTWGIHGNITKTTVTAKPILPQADLIEERTYGPCSQPATVKDPRGNITTYEYDPVHCGKTKEIGPAVDGVSPAKAFVYSQLSAWYRNSSGAYVAASSPVTLLTQEFSCKTGTLNFTNNTCSGGSSDLITTTFDYGPNSGPNNRLLRGVAVTADGQTLRTCYGYDSWGRRISETKPNADLSSCS